MRNKLEAALIIVIGESYLLVQAWEFFQRRPSLTAFATTALVYLPWLLAISYVGYRTWTRPLKVTSPTLDELDLAIREHADNPTAESETDVRRAAVQNLGKCDKVKS